MMLVVCVDVLNLTGTGISLSTTNATPWLGIVAVKSDAECVPLVFVNLITVFVTWSTVRSAACVDARAALTTVTGLAALSTSSSIASAPNSRSTDVDKYTRSRAVAALAPDAPANVLPCVFIASTSSLSVDVDIYKPPTKHQF